jgi:hypothetical protein
MFHKDRVWCVTAVAGADDLVEKLLKTTWTLCTGFRLGKYLFLNDSTGEDRAQEFAVVLDLGEGQYRQLESWTVGWMEPALLVEHVVDCLAGTLDNLKWAHPVSPTLQTPQEHGRCHLCA